MDEESADRGRGQELAPEREEEGGGGDRVVIRGRETGAGMQGRQRGRRKACRGGGGVEGAVIGTE